MGRLRTGWRSRKLLDSVEQGVGTSKGRSRFGGPAGLSVEDLTNGGGPRRRERGAGSSSRIQDLVRATPWRFEPLASSIFF